MKGLAGYLIGSLLLAALGGIALAAGALDTRVAGAQQDLATLSYDKPEAALDEAERYFTLASRVPWIGRRPLDEVRARKAALRYWQHQYAETMSGQVDPLASVPADNVDLQLVVANAIYRAGEARAKDRQSTLAAIDAGARAYLGVLKNATRNEDAAFNYEYLVRLREDLTRGRRKTLGPIVEATPHGRPGAPPPNTNMQDFKIHIPMDSSELEKKHGEEAGEGGVKIRKG